MFITLSGGMENLFFTGKCDVFMRSYFKVEARRDGTQN